MKMKSSKPGAFQTLTNNLKELSGVQAKVGWFESAKYENGTPVAYVAAIQELGSAQQSIPPRPFMRPTATDKKQEWSNVAAQGAKAVLAGKAQGGDVMEALGLKAESDVVKAIAAITNPPLSPVTIELRAMKQRNPNLIVTGATVGEAARRVSQPGYVTPNVSTKPLNETGYMIATLTHITESTQ